MSKTHLHKNMNSLDLFVFDGSPQSFYDDNIQGPASAVHADVDPVILQDVREILASVPSVLGALVCLVCVEDLGLPISLKGLFQGSCTKNSYPGYWTAPVTGP